MTGKFIVAFCCCVILAGCQTIDVIDEQIRITNPLGSPFVAREDLLNRIPAGTPFAKAESAMRAHGYDEWCSQEHDNHLTVTYRPGELGGIRSSHRDVTIHYTDMAVVDVEIHPAMDVAAPPATHS